jgi:large subunit ribosomal protein L24
MRKIQAWDTIIVTTGKHKGAESTVLSVSNDRVIVKGVNVVKKAVKWQGFVEKELPIHISNIAIYDAKAKSATKIGVKEVKWKRVRYSKKSDDTILSS